MSSGYIQPMAGFCTACKKEGLLFKRLQNRLGMVAPASVYNPNILEDRRGCIAKNQEFEASLEWQNPVSKNAIYIYIYIY